MTLLLVANIIASFSDIETKKNLRLTCRKFLEAVSHLTRLKCERMKEEPDEENRFVYGTAKFIYHKPYQECYDTIYFLVDHYLEAYQLTNPKWIYRDCVIAKKVRLFKRFNLCDQKDFAYVSSFVTFGYNMQKWIAKKGYLDIIKLAKRLSVSFNRRAVYESAIEHGQIKIIEYLSVEPNLKDTYLAAEYGQLGILKYFYDECVVKDELTAEKAARNGHFHIVRYFKQCYGINNLKILKKIMNHACTHCEVDFIKYLDDDRLLYDREVYLEDMLCNAAQKGYLDIVKKLCENGCNIKSRNYCAIKYAASNGHLEVVKYLWKKDSNVKAIKSGNYFAIQSAFASGHVHVVQFLLDQCCMKLKDIIKDDLICVFHAVKDGHVDVLELFFQQDYDPRTFSIVVSEGIENAAANGRLEMTRYLMSKVSNGTPDYETALMHASEKDYVVLVKLIAPKVNHEGRLKALVKATSAGHYDNVNYLWKSLGKIYCYDALENAVIYWRHSIIQLFCKKKIPKDDVKELLNKSDDYELQKFLMIKLLKWYGE